MTATLPGFPVDDVTLANVLHALDAAYEVDDEGTHTVVGAEFTLSHLLDFMSGYNESKGWLIGYAGDIPIYEYPDPVYTPHDVIRALVDEVIRLRGTASPSADTAEEA